MTGTRDEREEEHGWKRELGGRFAAFVDAYERRSLEAIREVFWHDDGIVVVGTQSNLHFIGWEWVEHSFRRQFESLRNIRGTLRTPPIWHGGASPSTMACLTVLAMDVEMTANDTPATFTGIRVACAFECRENAWKNVQMHWSLPRADVLVDHG